MTIGYVCFAKQRKRCSAQAYSVLYCTQRPYRKDRLLRAYFCCRQLAKFRIVRGICLYNKLDWLVCYKPAGQSFPDFGVWVSVNFDSKYKIVWGETRDHRRLILEEIKKLKKRIYIIIPIFPPPILSD